MTGETRSEDLMRLAAWMKHPVVTVKPHDSAEHAQHVLELANRLRADRIDCTIDQYVVAC